MHYKSQKTCNLCSRISIWEILDKLMLEPDRTEVASWAVWCLYNLLCLDRIVSLKSC
jgi:hypothetical protein